MNLFPWKYGYLLPQTIILQSDVSSLYLVDLTYALVKVENKQITNLLKIKAPEA